MLMRVPFFRYGAMFAMYESEYRQAMDDVLGRGAFILQQENQDFEVELAAFVGASHAYRRRQWHRCDRDGARCRRIGPGDEVILPSHTYIATAAAVHMVGATPVLAECGPDHISTSQTASSDHSSDPLRCCPSRSTAAHATWTR